MSNPVRIGSSPLAMWRDAFTPEEVDAIEAYGDRLTPSLAAIADRQEGLDPLRITRIAWIERNAETAWLYARLEEIVLRLNAEFYKFDLYGISESLQYTVYQGMDGGHYDWHVDMGNTQVEPRKISLSLQLSYPSRYADCDLMLEAGNGPCRAEKTRGTIIAFPSYVLHRVTPIAAGTRKSLVVWVGGPEFR